MIKAVAFDLGNTLIFSPFPLNWQNSYRNVITEIMTSLGLEINIGGIRQAENTLLKYNTRVNPREYEVNSSLVFAELFRHWDQNVSSLIKKAEEIFAAFFLDRFELYPDTIPVLKELQKKDIKVGILTNVPYGLSKPYFEKHISSLCGYYDVFLTSVEVGFRKPNRSGYYELARRLAVNTSDCMFVGDEEVDITGANNSGMASILIDRDGHNPHYGQAHIITSLEELLVFITN
jgi:putative hydrolase of the HAD superfamily